MNFAVLTLSGNNNRYKTALFSDASCSHDPRYIIKGIVSSLFSNSHVVSNLVTILNTKGDVRHNAALFMQ